MNVITDLQNRISRRLTETKTPCKFYKTVETAEKVASKLALEAAAYYSIPFQEKKITLEECRPVRYVIVWIEEVQKYAIGFDTTELFSRHDLCGGYVGILANQGHYNY